MTIFTDVETIPTQNAAIQAHIAAECAAENIAWAEGLVKYPDAERMRERGKEKLDEAYRRTSLNPALGELFCFAVAGDDDEPTLFTRKDWQDPASEVVLLKNAADVFASQRTIVAHGADFDQRFLRNRAAIRGVRMPESVNAMRKPWDRNLVWHCTMTIWDDRNRIKLNDLVLAIGRLDLLKGDIDGSKVWDAVQAGRGDEVGKYNCMDVVRARAVWAVVRTMIGAQ